MLFRLPGSVAKSVREQPISFPAGGAPGSLYRRSFAVLLRGMQKLVGGFTAASYSLGTVTTGTVTPDPWNGAFQHMTANGAFTLAAPTRANCCSICIEILNGASAGTITPSGFTKSDVSAYNTTNTNKFLAWITKSANYTSLRIEALQ